MKALVIAANAVGLALRSWALYVLLGFGLLAVFALGGVVRSIPREWMIQAEQFADSRQPGVAVKVQEELDEEEYREVMSVTARDVCFIYLLVPAGVVCAVVLSALFNETRRPTTQTIASRPIRRSAIVLGSFLSALGVTLVVVAALAVGIWLLGLALLGESHWRVFYAAAAVCAALVAVAAWATCFSTLVNPIAAVPLALLHTAAGWKSVAVMKFLQDIAQREAPGPPGLAAAGKLAYWLMPHYQHTHELAKALLFGDPVDPTTVDSIYLGLAHAAVALALASAVLKRRDL